MVVEILVINYGLESEDIDKVHIVICFRKDCCV